MHPVAPRWDGTKEEQSLIRAQFGDGKLDQESIKFYADNELFISTDASQMEEQIAAAILLLDLESHWSHDKKLPIHNCIRCRQDYSFWIDATHGN